MPQAKLLALGGSIRLPTTVNVVDDGGMPGGKSTPPLGTSVHDNS